MSYILDFTSLLFLGQNHIIAITNMEIKILNRIIDLLQFKLKIELLILKCSEYMAPKYAMFGQFSIKLDVFSFGVLILEVLSGQKITHFHDGENSKYLLSYVSMTTKYRVYISFLYTKNHELESI